MITFNRLQELTNKPASAGSEEVQQIALELLYHIGRLEHVDRLNQSLSVNNNYLQRKTEHQQKVIERLQNETQDQRGIMNAFANDEADWHKLANKYEGYLREFALIILKEKLKIERLETDNHYLNESSENLSVLLLAEQNNNQLLVAENTQLKEQLTNIINSDIDYHNEGIGCGLEDNDITDRYEAAEYGFNQAREQFYCDIVPSIDDIETPATDAAINEIKAQAIEEAVKSIVLVYDKDDDVASTYDVALMKYAAQLRKGE